MKLINEDKTKKFLNLFGLCELMGWMVEFAAASSIKNKFFNYGRASRSNWIQRIQRAGWGAAMKSINFSNNWIKTSLFNWLGWLIDCSPMLLRRGSYYESNCLAPQGERRAFLLLINQFRCCCATLSAYWFIHFFLSSTSQWRADGWMKKEVEWSGSASKQQTLSIKSNFSYSIEKLI